MGHQGCIGGRWDCPCRGVSDLLPPCLIHFCWCSKLCSRVWGIAQWAGLLSGMFLITPIPESVFWVSSELSEMIIITSNPRPSSCSTVQSASRSKPLTLNDPNFSEVIGSVGGVGVGKVLRCRVSLSFLDTFCLCFWGLKVSLSINLLVLVLAFLFL